MLHQSARLLDHHVGDLDVAGGGLVEGRGDDLGLHGPLHVRHLFRALVDEQHDEHHLGVVLGDGVRDVLQDHRLAGLGRRRDERPLALPDRRDQIDDARGEAAPRRLEVELLLGIEGRQVVEEDLVPGVLGRLQIDRVDLEQREVPLALLRRADLPENGVAGPQVEAANLGGRHVDVVGPGQVVLVRRAQEAEAVGQRLERALGVDPALLLGLGLEDLEDQILLAQAGGVLDRQVFTELGEFLGSLQLEIRDVQALGIGIVVVDLVFEGLVVRKLRSPAAARPSRALFPPLRDRRPRPRRERP